MSVPSTKPEAVAPPAPPRQPRGYIASYGVGRVCSNAGCGTTLSRYNDSVSCWHHADNLEQCRYRGLS
jgi:hypothetical protein